MVSLKIENYFQHSLTKILIKSIQDNSMHGNGPLACTGVSWPRQRI